MKQEVFSKYYPNIQSNNFSICWSTSETDFLIHIILLLMFLKVSNLTFKRNFLLRKQEKVTELDRVCMEVATFSQSFILSNQNEYIYMPMVLKLVSLVFFSFLLLHWLISTLSLYRIFIIQVPQLFTHLHLE